MNFPMGIFLAGLIDGDGHISKKCITISFHNATAAQEIQNYLGHGILRKCIEL
jgi:hypothetical protein